MKVYEEQELITAINKMCNSCFSIEELKNTGIRPYEISVELAVSETDIVSGKVNTIQSQPEGFTLTVNFNRGE